MKQTWISLKPFQLFLSFILLSVSALHCSEEDAAKPKVRLIVNDHFRGEIETAARLKIACDHLGWTAVLKDIQELKNDPQQYDFSITLVPHKGALRHQTDYLTLMDPENHFFTKDGHITEQYASYSGYLCVYENTVRLFQDLHGDSCRIFQQRWFPSAYHVPYRKVNPDQLFFIISTWGNRRYHPKYRALQNLLAEKKYTAFYGSPQIGEQYGDTFKGDIQFDGVSLIDRISESGVCLVLHSDVHLKHKIPSGRIFESAAASAVIICDLNQFVIDQFGDSVLYVDQRLSSKKLFDQIDEHMKWIKKHPQEALEMARKSHQIFVDHFLLENQLLNLEAYRQNCLNNQR